jgi:hypothetical protein
VAALLELERGAQPGLDLADGQRDLCPGPGGGAELLAGSVAEGVALALLIGSSWAVMAGVACRSMGGLLGGQAGAGACLVPGRK